MPTPDPSTTDAPAAKERGARTPFPRYERVSERLADRTDIRREEDEARASRELEIPRTESYGELWTRAQARRLRSR